MNRWCALAVVLCVGGAAALAGGQTGPIVFSKDSAGKVPAGWKVEKTGKGDAGAWKVVADDTAPSKKGHVLAQTTAGPKTVFNLCVLDKPSVKDLEATVHFKAVKGDEDQGGGIVWRYQDANNYYVARMNPLEDNYRLYKVVGGSRKQLATKEGVKAETGTWHTLTIRHVGDQIECSLDGKKYLEHKDAEFAKAGQVGLWTKADAQTSFDNFTIKDLGK
jgi:hypothetical protein